MKNTVIYKKEKGKDLILVRDGIEFKDLKIIEKE